MCCIFYPLLYQIYDAYAQNDMWRNDLVMHIWPWALQKIILFTFTPINWWSRARLSRVQTCGRTPSRWRQNAIWIVSRMLPRTSPHKITYRTSLWTKRVDCGQCLERYCEHHRITSGQSAESWFFAATSKKWSQCSCLAAYRLVSRTLPRTLPRTSRYSGASENIVSTVSNVAVNIGPFCQDHKESILILGQNPRN